MGEAQRATWELCIVKIATLRNCVLLACLLVGLSHVPAQADELLPQGNNTVVGFGDSTTAPRGALFVYSDILRAELPLYGITGSVVNSGVGGHTSSDGMARFNSDVRDYNPDLVVIQFGINDSTWNVWANPPATAPRISLATYTSNITYMTQTLKNDGAQVVLMTPNPMRWTDQLVGLYGTAPYDPSDPMGFNATLIPYCQAVRDIAAAESVPLLDVYNMYVAYDQVSGQSMDDLLLDGMHPNTAGQRMTGDALIDLITGGADPIQIPPQTVTPKSSEDFTHAYEADGGLPTVEDSGSGKTNWAFFNHSTVDAGFAVSQGALSYSTMAYTSGGEWFHTDSSVAGSAWIAEVSAATSYTVEFSAKVTGGKGNVPGLHFFVDNGVERIWLNVDTDHVATNSGSAEVSLLVDGIDNASEFHVYRLAFEADSRKYQIWRDGVQIGFGESATTTTGDSYLGFGDGTSQGFGAAEIDYFRWDATGAYTPILMAGDANGDGRIDDADATILAANWLTAADATWGQGDFNGDGQVNETDATLLAVNWHAGKTTSAAVPEPHVTAMLLALGIAWLALRRRN